MQQNYPVREQLAFNVHKSSCIELEYMCALYTLFLAERLCLCSSVRAQNSNNINTLYKHEKRAEVEIVIYDSIVSLWSVSQKRLALLNRSAIYFIAEKVK